MRIEFFRDLKSQNEGEQIEIGETPLKALVLIEADNSDPLNQWRVIGFKCGNIGARIHEWHQVAAPADMLTALLRFCVDHVEEIREACK